MRPPTLSGKIHEHTYSTTNLCGVDSFDQIFLDH